VKADKAIRLLKTVSALSVQISDLVPPALSAVGQIDNNGWTLDTAVKSPAPQDNQTFTCTWEDTIDIAGLAANDISLVNQGGAVARPASPYWLGKEDMALTQMTLVSVNPIEVTSAQLSLANALNTEGNLQDYFLATSQEFQKAADSVYFSSKSGEHNFGTGGIAQATKLYVKSFVWGYVNAELPALSTNVVLPPVTIAIGAVTAELDPVQMAAAIYRANDQE